MKFHKKLAVLSLSAATSLGSMITAIPTIVHAEENQAATAVTSVEQGDSSNIVNITFQDGKKGRVTFLTEGIFRYNIDPKGEFSKYAADSGSAKIQAQPDEDTTGIYTHPAAAIENGANTVTISSGSTQIILNKADGKMTIKSGNKTVMEESEPIRMSGGKSVQTLVQSDGEDFYGGGTQNGRFVHTGEEISISNTNNWTDGGVASPNPFYWSTKGYGVLRNSFKPGTYNFGKTLENTVTTEHEETEFDAYYFVSGADSKAGIANDLIGDYFTVTGNPVLLPEYAFYLGHLNCYNRDTWSNESGSKRWTIKGSSPASDAGTSKFESGMASGYIVPAGSHAESLNGKKPTVNADQFQAADTPREFSAQAVIDRYQDADMPFGWFLPNDGYGCGYGQNGYNMSGGSDAERQASLDANLQNLKEFTDYANAHGVSTGLWTQSNLTPIASEKQQLVRDFRGEVLTGGITSLKTDVAWVGAGYTFGLNGIKSAYDIVTDEAGKRPNIVTLDGWAGTQRYGTIWTGDQYGGNWEYIRFHIPTYIGQNMSGNPNIGSDMDGIFGGAPIIATRDYQWKTFTTTMLDMDGWGSYVKSPNTHGDPYTGISRMYLKLKAQLMPYLYTTAASAANIDTKNGDTGMPMIRAMSLADESDYAASKNTQYQYMFGDSFLVAPIYQDTQMDAATGNDIRNDIYLPGDENTTWIDYFSGKQYKGGQILSNFDAPLWKLPLFVRAGSIIPMYEENNNPVAVSETNPDGLDKTKRIVEFYPKGNTSYTLYEDDGISADTETKQDSDYGLINKVTYGGAVQTTFTSNVDGTTATLKAGRSEGSYEGYNSNRSTKFVVNVSKEPTSVDINGAAGNKVATLEAFKALGEDESGWFYDAAPEMNKYSGEEDFADTHIINSPKVYVKFAKTDVSANEQTAVIKGFENTQDMGKDTEISSIPVPAFNEVTDENKTPTSIDLSWNAVDGALGYEVKMGDMTYVTDKPSLTVANLTFKTEYTFQIRARKSEGVSAWSAPMAVTTLDDPWRNTPTPAEITWTGDIYGSHNASLAFDHVFQSGDGGFHSNGKAIGESLTVDLGLVYPLASLEYFPRTDAGNGTVTSMDIATSMDGIYWNELPTQTWQANADTKTVELSGAARYVRMIPRSSVGSFFSASEIKINKTEEGKGFALGSNLNRAEVSDGDYSNLLNYKGLQNSQPDTSTFQSQIAAHFADLNNNGVYDVYDYSYTMRALEGGTTKTGAPAGSLFFLADKSDVKAGDIVTITMYGDNISNANAIGGLFNYDTDLFEAIIEAGTSGVYGSPFLGDMENLSSIRTYDDGHGTVNVAFANKGDKDLYAGTRTVATFKLRAKEAGTIDNSDDSMLDMAQNSMIVSPTGQVIDKTYEHGYDASQVPTVDDKILAQSDLNLTMTNDALPTDDGTNVQTLTHSGNFNGLFNGNNTDRQFEFVWTVETGKYDTDVHKVPMTIHMGLKKPTPVKTIDVYAGALSSNGHVKKVQAVITYADGTTTEFAGGDYDAESEHYLFTVPADKANVSVTNIDFTVLESGRGTEADPANGTLTLCEIVIAAKGAADITSIAAADSNAKQINIGAVSRVEGVVAPAGAYQFFKVTSSDEDIAAIDCVRDGNDMNWFVLGKKDGKATITLTSLIDETKTASYEVEVGDFIDKAELTAAINRATAIKDAQIVDDASMAKLEAAITAAESASSTADSQDGVDAAVIALNRVLSSLNYRAPKEANLINIDAESGVTVVGGSSDCNPDTTGLDEGDGLGTFEATLDKNEETYWHSNWSTGLGMPQYILYDLGKEYDLTDVSFLPRVGRYNGDMFEVELQAGISEDDLTSIGTWTFEHTSNQLADRGWHTMTFPVEKVRYVKVIVHKAGGDQLDQYASMAEINFYCANDLSNPDVDTALLQLVADKAKALAEADFKADEAWNALSAELAHTDAVLEAPRTQKQVNDAASALNEALLAVRLAPSRDKLPK